MSNPNEVRVIKATITRPQPLQAVIGTTMVPPEELTINPSIETQYFENGKIGYSPITVNPVTSEIDSDIKATNIKQGINILGVTGSVVELNGQTRTETLNSVNGNTYTPNGGYNAITSIKVSPRNLAKTVSATTSSQTFTVPSGYSGYGTITVNPVTASIDSDIKPTNIRQGVNILGVEGSVIELKGEKRTVSLTANSQTFIPTNDYNGITSIKVSSTNKNITIIPTVNSQELTVPSGYSGYGTITVNPVTASIDPDIKSQNILKGINILGVEGSIDFETLTVNPSVSSQTFTPTKNGYSKVTVNPVTASIDSDIVSQNIKQGINILGIEGSVIELHGQTRTETLNSVNGNTYAPTNGYNGITSIKVSPKNFSRTITPSVNEQTFSVPGGYSGHGTISVNPVTASIDPNITSENVRYGTTILGVTGNWTGSVPIIIRTWSE